MKFQKYILLIFFLTPIIGFGQKNGLLSIKKISSVEYHEAKPVEIKSPDASKPLEKIDGAIKVPLANGGFREFVDYEKSFEDKVKHEYLGEFRDVGITVIKSIYYEWANVVLVDKNNGWLTYAWFDPQLSPDNTRVCSIRSYGYDGSNVGVQVLDIVNQSQPLSHRLLVEINQTQWQPLEFYWFDNATINIKAKEFRLMYDDQDEPMPDIFLQLQISN